MERRTEVGLTFGMLSRCCVGLEADVRETREGDETSRRVESFACSVYVYEIWIACCSQLSFLSPLPFSLSTSPPSSSRPKVARNSNRSALPRSPLSPLQETPDSVDLVKTRIVIQAATTIPPPLLPSFVKPGPRNEPLRRDRRTSSSSS